MNILSTKGEVMSEFGTGNDDFTLSASNGEKIPIMKSPLHNSSFCLQPSRVMAAALKAKGYAYRYVFAEAAGHTDGCVTRQTLPGALESLWQGYPVK